MRQMTAAADDTNTPHLATTAISEGETLVLIGQLFELQPVTLMIATDILNAVQLDRYW